MHIDNIAHPSLELTLILPQPLSTLCIPFMIHAPMSTIRLVYPGGGGNSSRGIGSGGVGSESETAAVVVVMVVDVMPLVDVGCSSGQGSFHWEENLSLNPLFLPFKAFLSLLVSLGGNLIT